MNKSRKLIIVGQTPPPNNGQAKMIQQMIDGLRPELDLLHIRMAYSASVATAGKFQFSKIAHLLHLIRETRRQLKENPRAVLYYPPASPKLIPILRDIVFLCAVRPLAGKVVFHFHAGGLSGFVAEHAWIRPMAMKAYREADAVIELGRSCPRDGLFFNAKSVFTVPYGINFPIKGIPAENSSGDDGTLRILYVGIHTETKGLFDLLLTAEELKRRGVSFKMNTVGVWYTDHERRRFEKMVCEKNLSEYIQTLGRKIGEELEELYLQADVLFFPTFYPWETFGIVQLEAMACGCPIVASDWQGPRDVVVHEKTGFLCPIHDIAAFADSLQRLAADPQMRRRMGDAGKEHYRRNFTVECFINNLGRIFREVSS